MLLTRTLSEAIPHSGYWSEIKGGTSKYVKEKNTSIYGLAQCWHYIGKDKRPA